MKLSIKQLFTHLKSDFDRPVVMSTSVDAKPASVSHAAPPQQQTPSGVHR